MGIRKQISRSLPPPTCNGLPMVCLLLVLAMSGCVTTARFDLANWTGKDIAVRSAHTKRGKSISANGHVILPHGFGDLVVDRGGDDVWVYRDVSPLQFNYSRQYAEYKRGVFGATLTVRAALSGDGGMYILPVGVTSTNLEGVEQPPGYPIMGIKRGGL